MSFCHGRCFSRFRMLILCLLFLIGLSQIYVFFSTTDLNRVDHTPHVSEPVEFRFLKGSDDGRYKIWPFVWRSSHINEGNISVGIATQCSVKNLKYLITMVNYWNGPISVATFLVGNELDKFKRNLRYFVNCNQAIAKRVSFHLVFPISHPPSEQSLEINEIYQKDICSTQLDINNRDGVNYDDHRGPYPVNVLRNLAVQGLHTSHVLMLDVDMVPSINLNSVLLISPHIHQNLNALVIPAFEIRYGMKIPVTKSELLLLWNSGEMRPFYEKVCWKCQKYTLYDLWRLPSVSGLASYSVSWYDPWEPFYVAMKKDVVYDERFEQYGFNRISQLCHLHMLGTSFSVLYDSYIIHQGFKEKSSFHNDKDIENEKNKIIYRKVKAEMLNKYSKSGRHC